MTDSKLLELAAKAVKNGATFSKEDPFKLYAMRLPCGAPWNPLDDPGDNLRLGIDLKINIMHFQDDVRAIPHDQSYAFGICLYGDDPYYATRRALVVAAAEIGRSMK